MKPELANHLNKLRDTVAEMDRILALRKCPNNPRNVAVAGLLSTIVQHHHSILQLINSGAIRSAVALIRDTVDGMYCGLWINSCATLDQRRALKDENAPPPSLPQIIKSVDAAFKADPLFENVKNRCGMPLYKSNRVGILQLGCWSLDSKSDPGLHQDERELCEVTTTATLCILFLAAEFLAKQNHPAESHAVQALAAGLH
jgi:hypothetical protein